VWVGWQSILIMVKEPLDPSWSEWFDGFAISYVEGQGTKILGGVRDQTALHGLLVKIRNLNLTWSSVRKFTGEGEKGQGKGFSGNVNTHSQK